MGRQKKLELFCYCTVLATYEVIFERIYYKLQGKNSKLCFNVIDMLKRKKHGTIQDVQFKPQKIKRVKKNMKKGIK